MTVPAFEPINPAGQADAAELKRLARTTEANDKVSGNRTVAVRRSAGGLSLDAPLPLEFWARVGAGTNPYAWTRVIDAVSGGVLTFSTDPEGLAGTVTPSSVFPAYEENGNAAVPNGKVVWLRLSRMGDYYLFRYPCTY